MKEITAQYSAQNLQKGSLLAPYSTPGYRGARDARIQRASGRCEALMASSDFSARCPNGAVDVIHVVRLALATTLDEAIVLCGFDNLRAVCGRHRARSENQFFQPAFGGN